MYIVSGDGSGKEEKVKKEKGKTKEAAKTKAIKKDSPGKLSSSQIEVIKNKVAKLAGVEHSTVRIEKKGRTAACDALPLTLYPIAESKKGNKTADIGEPYLDFDSMVAFSRKVWKTGPWIGERLTQGLCVQFLRNVVLEDPESFEGIKNSSVIYLANHQVQVESLLFPMVIQFLTNRRAITIANAIHQTSWLGPLDELIYRYPGVTYPRNIVYFKQTARESMFDLIENFKAKIRSEGASVFLHVEGELGLSCRSPVRKLSSVFIDLATDLNIPIVPVRFVGGLPVKKMKTTLEFPLGYCKQDYHVGRPISPKELIALPYAERRNRVIEALNSVGPSHDVETPYSPDPDFIKDVNSWIDDKGVAEVQAVLFKTMERLKNLGHESKAFIRGAHKGFSFGNDPKGRWLADLAGMLFGKITVMP
jgi:hypothetical protein